MKRVIGWFLVAFILGGLFLAFRDARSLMARPGTRAPSIADDGLTTPPNWKVEPAEHPPTADRTQSRLATASGNSTARSTTFGATSANSSPPLWTRRDGKVAAPAPTYLPRNPSAESPTASFSTPNGTQEAARKGGRRTITLLSAFRPNRQCEGDRRRRSASRPAASRSVLDQGRPGAGRQSPLAADPVAMCPGRPIAAKARLTLDTIRLDAGKSC